MRPQYTFNQFSFLNDMIWKQKKIFNEITFFVSWVSELDSRKWQKQTATIYKTKSAEAVDRGGQKIDERTPSKPTIIVFIKLAANNCYSNIEGNENAINKIRSWVVN